jgi:hypothetical protein
VEEVEEVEKVEEVEVFKLSGGEVGKCAIGTSKHPDALVHFSTYPLATSLLPLLPLHSTCST